MASAARSPYRTIPVRPDTWARLRDYKMGGASFDAVLNDLMDAVPVERISKELIKEHRERLKTFKGASFRNLRRD